MALESTCSTCSRNPLYTSKEFFLKPIYQRILRICVTMALLYYYDQTPFRIFLSCIFFKFSNPSKTSPDLYKKAKP